MTWSNRVAWQEGMFLRPQHFQQQDRSFEQLVRARTAHLRPYGWGLAEYAIDRNLLGTGRFALASATGVFEDGTPFALPGEADHPVPLEVPATARNTLVYLGLPIQQPGSLEMAAPGSPDGRYGIDSFEAYDTHSEALQPADLLVGRLRLRFLLETEERAGWLCIPLARIVEVGSDRRVTLDDQWIPPALLCASTSVLSGLMTEFAGMINQRGEVLAARLTAPGGRGGVAGVQDFLLLQTLNRWQKLLEHWADAGSPHPETLYAGLVQMAAEFATFTAATRRPATYPPYRHEDLQRSFAPVVADLRRSLAAVIETNAISITLVERRHNVRVGAITDRGILRSASFVLSVQADVPTETLRRLFPAQVKVGAVEHIRELVNMALTGITVRPLPVAPREIPFYAGASYFELDRNSPHWQQMQTSGGFAIHLSGEFPNLAIELWAIRGQE